MSGKTETNETQTMDISYFYKNNRFFHFLSKTKKYKDLYWSKEAAVSFILAMISLVICLFIVFKIDNITKVQEQFSVSKIDIEGSINFIRNTLNIIIAGLFSLLGFLVGGLAILAGMANNKILKNIIDSGKGLNFFRILFTFYFAGAILGFTLVTTIISYLITYTSFPFSVGLFSFLCFIVSYFMYFIMIYTIMLLGTSLRFFLLNYHYFSE
ncbi:hypothetical protein ACFQZT_16735 [Paenibacillus sp. GCM10027628]|uniref:hypothetical protein n=1 Tax=Paenibacillus sp. GCM10027628 TaxID=3273413 RepID=UPI00363136D9